MKLKKSLSSIIIGMSLTLNPTIVLGWLQQRYQYNIVNIRISNLLRFIAIIASLAYILVAILYMVNSQQEKNKKIKNILIWLIITIIAVALLVYGANLVFEAGITYM